MVFESKDFYIDLVDIEDLDNIVEVYNSNKNFLINHMDREKAPCSYYEEKTITIK